ncbi:unnamed protein product [Ectocarpus sp. 12 AP-2014]
MIGERLLPIARRAVPAGAATGGGAASSFSSSLTAFSLALKLVLARGWESSSVTSTGANLPTSCWLTAPAVPCIQRCTTQQSSSSRLDAKQKGRRLRFRGPSAAWPFCSGDIDRAGAGMHACRSIRLFSRGPWTSGRVATSVESQAGFMYAERICRATAPSTRRLASSRSVGAGYASTALTGGGGGCDGDDDNPGTLPATAVKMNLRSLRTARERGSVRNKGKKSKPIKGEPSSSPPPSPASSSAPGGGGARLLRLSKLLADRAIGTRSEVDTLVRRGRVKVDGAVVKSPKAKLPVDCVIEVNGEVYGPVPLLVAFHKPKGVITTLSDDWDREDLSDVLPKSLLLKHHPVGRLDADSSGLLLLSSDGALTHRLLNPRFEVEREYVASVDVPPEGEEPGDSLVTALNEGITTADGVYRADVPAISGRDVRVVVREGKNRMVRRMLANAGYPVLELRRERYGKILLGDLPEGEHVPVSGEALEWARSVLQLQAAIAVAVDGGRDEKGVKP